MTLLYPLITEKALALQAQGQYTFAVEKRANRSQVKKEVERLYKTKVSRVHIAYKPSKRRRLGRIEGERKGFKKAIVFLQKGQKISL